MLKRLRDNITQEPYFLELRKDRQFRRTTCALAWPWSDVPGCVLVLGEVRNPSNEIGARRHLYVLAEVRGYNTDDLLDNTERLQMLWLFPRVITPTADKRIALLDDFNDARRLERKPILRVSDPPLWSGKGEGMLPYYLSLVERRITEEKSLVFGADCSARDDVKRAGKEELTRKVIEMPGVCALCWAIEEIDSNTMPEWHERGRRGVGGPADGLGGY